MTPEKMFDFLCTFQFPNVLPCQSSIANEYQEEEDGYRYKMPSLLEIE
jgi:hypothetical protein